MTNLMTASHDRAPFPGAVPRPVKTSSDRDTPSRVTAHIRVLGAEVDDPTRDYIRRKLGMKLAKFTSSLERVSVRLVDLNGPRGGVDQLCLIKVVLSGLPSVVVEERHSDTQVAIDSAIRVTESVIQRRLSKRQLKPRNRRRLRR